jgi:hypothetical protein
MFLAIRFLERKAACGAIAQLGERLLCKQEVVGSIPSGSTISFDDGAADHAIASFVRR